MSGRTTFGAAILAIAALAFSAATARRRAGAAGPASRLSRRQDRLQLPRRHLDRERGRHEPCTALTDNIAREVYPRFSPDGKWIAFSSNRYGNYDVFVDPRRRRRAQAADVPHRQRRSRRLVARLAARASSAPRAATARSRASRPLSDARRAAAWRSRCRSTGATGAATRPTASRSSSTAIPSTWSRKHYRGSYAADLWVADLERQDLHQAPRRRAVQPLLADVGRRQLDLLRRRSAAQRQERQAGQPRGPQERQQHLQDPRDGRGQPVQVTKHIDGSVFWPSMSSDGKVIVYEENFGIWKLDVASGRTQRDQDRHRDRREGQRSGDRDRHQRGRQLRPLAVRPARRHLGARPDPHDRHRSRRHHPGHPGQDGVAQRLAEVVARRQVHRLRLGQVGPRRSLDLRSGGQDAEEDHRSRQREGRARLDAGLEVAALHRRGQEAVQLRRRRREDRP